MLLQETTTTIAEFEAHAREHFARVRQSDGVEYVMNGDEQEAVVISPELYARMSGKALADYEDSVKKCNEGHQQYLRGECRDAREFFAELREKFNISKKH